VFTCRHPSKRTTIIESVSYTTHIISAPTFSDRSQKEAEKITDLKIGYYKTKRPARDTGRWSPATGHLSSSPNWPLLVVHEARVTNHDARLIWYSKERSQPQLIRYGSAASLL
jgi:hypothetical protein